MSDGRDTNPLYFHFVFHRICTAIFLIIFSLCFSIPLSLSLSLSPMRVFRMVSVLLLWETSSDAVDHRSRHVNKKSSLNCQLGTFLYAQKQSSDALDP
jgi:hypothetical protein